ncbi:MAG: 7-carboxy-7-deazaguanine synthase QueE [Planctomycetes bacterium]|nr:7-carboxy-7-deazaguanine synthase QueE [Planctomycetota bacterium]
MSARVSGPSVRAPVLEVFASIQGEGAFVGEPQVFLRLFGCPLRCRWCDTPGSWKVPAQAEARIAASAGARREPCWASAFQAACWIAECEPGNPRSLSVTGGEPLAWPDFLLALKPLVGGRRLHLETAGAHPRALARVLSVCDHVSLDLKPELDLDEPQELPPVDAELAQPFRALDGSGPERSPRTREEWKRAREACLRLVAARDACAKIVVSGAREARDFAGLLDELEECAPSLTLYLTPATPIHGVRAPARELVENVAEMARDRDLRVRVVPQVHRVLAVP